MDDHHLGGTGGNSRARGEDWQSSWGDDPERLLEKPEIPEIPNVHLQKKYLDAFMSRLEALNLHLEDPNNVWTHRESPEGGHPRNRIAVLDGPIDGPHGAAGADGLKKLTPQQKKTWLDMKAAANALLMTFMMIRMKMGQSMAGFLNRTLDSLTNLSESTLEEQKRSLEQANESAKKAAKKGGALKIFTVVTAVVMTVAAIALTAVTLGAATPLIAASAVLLVTAAAAAGFVAGGLTGKGGFDLNKALAAMEIAATVASVVVSFGAATPALFAKIGAKLAARSAAASASAGAKAGATAAAKAGQEAAESAAMQVADNVASNVAKGAADDVVKAAKSTKDLNKAKGAAAANSGDDAAKAGKETAEEATTGGFLSAQSFERYFPIAVAATEGSLVVGRNVVNYHLINALADAKEAMANAKMLGTIVKLVQDWYKDTLTLLAALAKFRQEGANSIQGMISERTQALDTAISSIGSR
jgi:hypothetical protein